VCHTRGRRVPDRPGRRHGTLVNRDAWLAIRVGNYERDLRGFKVALDAGADRRRGGGDRCAGGMTDISHASHLFHHWLVAGRCVLAKVGGFISSYFG
jgi:hypothetical protein